MPQQPTPTGPTPVELKMRPLAYAFAAKHKLPMGEVLINRFVLELQAALPKARPSDREAPTTKVPRGVRARAAALAGNREAASKRAVRPPAAPGTSSAPVSVPKARSGPLRAIEDPLALEVLPLLAEGLSNPEISKKLGVSVPTVRYRVRLWMDASAQDSREDVVDWARHAGLLDTGAQR